MLDVKWKISWIIIIKITLSKQYINSLMNWKQMLWLMTISFQCISYVYVVTYALCQFILFARENLCKWNLNGSSVFDALLINIDSKFPLRTSMFEYRLICCFVLYVCLNKLKVFPIFISVTMSYNWFAIRLRKINAHGICHHCRILILFYFYFCV